MERERCTKKANVAECTCACVNVITEKVEAGESGAQCHSQFPKT